MDKNWKDKELFIDYCDHKTSQYAVTKWHYSKIVPGGRLVRFGVWEKGKFIGTILYGCGVNKEIGRFINLKMHEISELVRVALDNHKNPVSKIVSFCMKKLRKDFPNIKAVVSYADPIQNHKGKIYQAMNWLYLGETKTATHYMLDGKFYHSRSLNQKNRENETFDRSAYEKVYLKKYKYIYLFDKGLKKQLNETLKQYIA